MSIPTFRLDGKVALVTGGSQGLGYGMAEALAAAGADLMLVARSEDRLTDAASRLRSYGGRVDHVSADLGDIEEAFRAVDETVERFGRLDILFAAAGTQVRKAALEVTPEDWERLCAVNLRGVFFISQRAAQAMLAREPDEPNGVRGKIILVASLTAEIPWPNVCVYGVTKGGVAQMTKALAHEWGKHGICVNAIGPGTFPTELTEPLYAGAERVQAIVERVPLGRPGRPEDLAGATVLLASPASDYMTGQILWVDGGWLIG